MCLVQIYLFNHTRKVDYSSKRERIMFVVVFSQTALRVLLYSYGSLRVCLLTPWQRYSYYPHDVSCAANLLLVHFFNLWLMLIWFLESFCGSFFSFFSSTPLLMLAHLVERFSFATALSWHFFYQFYQGVFIFCTIQRFFP